MSNPPNLDAMRPEDMLESLRKLIEENQRLQEENEGLRQELAEFLQTACSRWRAK